MLNPHKDFHTFWTPAQIILNERCPQLSIPEQSEIINKLEIVEITQGFPYFFQIRLNQFCLHERIPEHAEIIDTLKNVHISLDQSKKTILQKVCTLTIMSSHALARTWSRQKCCSRCSPAPVAASGLWVAQCGTNEPRQRPGSVLATSRQCQDASGRLRTLQDA